MNIHKNMPKYTSIYKLPDGSNIKTEQSEQRYIPEINSNIKLDNSNDRFIVRHVETKDVIYNIYTWYDYVPDWDETDEYYSPGCSTGKRQNICITVELDVEWRYYNIKKFYSAKVTTIYIFIFLFILFVISSLIAVKWNAEMKRIPLLYNLMPFTLLVSFSGTLLSANIFFILPNPNHNRTKLVK